MKKIYFTALFLSLLFTGCNRGDDQQAQQNPRGWGAGGFGNFGGGNRVTSVETQRVTFQPIAEQVKSFGTIKAEDVIAITPQTSNRLTNIYVDLGDTVRQGQLLAKINDATFRDQLNQAQANLNQSKIAVQRDSSAYERQKFLLERELTSASEYENALATFQNSLAQYESSKASLTQAEENFSFTEVRSPVRGVIISRNAEVGDLANSNTVLFDIANLVGYETRVFLPVQDWRFIKIGQTVNLRVSNEGETSAQGVVSRKSPQLDATTGLGEVVISLTNSGESIYPGVLTESVIDIVNKPSAIVIPRSAMVEKVETIVEPESNSIQLERTYSVFVSIGDSVAELRPLTLGIEQGDKIEVLAGLRPGESIIVTGQNSLQDGGNIRVATGSDFSSPEIQRIASGSSAGGWSANGGGNRPGRTGAPGDTSGVQPRPGGPGGMFASMSEQDRQRLQNMTQEERRAFMDSLRTANNN
ncbi:MAG: efflux RND transporter periplasmic adaptor subunit [Balneolales bacterium]|nr:efflux RND transporter periplasmic adaptor subunit [Balneolales bacterium]